MDQNPALSYTNAELEAAFIKRYLGDFHQIDRRMREQVTSGNLERIGEKFKITKQGRAFITLSRTIVWLFDTDPRFVVSESQNFRAPDRK
jgi:hypothetical protein